MNLAHILNAYINVNLLVIAGFLCMGLYQLLVYLKRKPVGAGALVNKIAYLFGGQEILLQIHRVTSNTHLGRIISTVHDC